MNEQDVFVNNFRVYHTDSGLAPNNALALLFVKLKGLDILACVFDDDEIESLIGFLKDAVIAHLHCEGKLFRINKDVFALTLPGLLSKELMRVVTHRLLSVIDRQHSIQGKPVHLRGHIGITFLESCVESGKDAIKQANTALYEACESNRPFVIYEDQQTELADLQISLSSELDGALDRSEFFLEYQPQLDLGSGQIESAEALIRWENSKHGRVRPDHFIPLAEKRGMIARISEWVIDNAMRFQNELDGADLNLTLSVNLSPGDLMNSFLPDYIDQSLSIWNPESANSMLLKCA